MPKRETDRVRDGKDMKRSCYSALVAISLWAVSMGGVLSEAVQATEWVECPADLVETAASDAMPPNRTPAFPCGEVSYSHYVFKKYLDGKIRPFFVEGPRRGQVRSTLSYKQLKALLDSGKPVSPELRMTRKTLAKLVSQLETARAVAERYRDVQVALQDGFTVGLDAKSGTSHFFHEARLHDGVFNAAEPEMLMYRKDKNGQWEFTGTLAYMVGRDRIGDDHPEGFAGPLDNWHVHYNQCSLVSEMVSDPKSCEALGGLWVQDFGWMIHVWAMVENPNGVFALRRPPEQPGGVVSEHKH